MLDPGTPSPFTHLLPNPAWRAEEEPGILPADVGVKNKPSVWLILEALSGVFTLSPPPTQDPVFSLPCKPIQSGVWGEVDRGYPQSLLEVSSSLLGPVMDLVWGPCGLYPPILSPQTDSVPEPFLPTLRGSLDTRVTLAFPCLPALRALAPIGGGRGARKMVPQPGSLCPEGTCR